MPNTIDHQFEEERLDKECKKLEDYGSEKFTYPEKIVYYLPIIEE